MRSTAFRIRRSIHRGFLLQSMLGRFYATCTAGESCATTTTTTTTSIITTTTTKATTTTIIIIIIIGVVNVSEKKIAKIQKEKTTTSAIIIIQRNTAINANKTTTIRRHKIDQKIIIVIADKSTIDIRYRQHHHHNHHHNNLRHHHNNEDEGQVLCREIMNTASGHFGINLISFILKDLKLIVGGHSGEIHIWHIGNRRSAFNMTPNWERESILRGHGDRVTRLEAFGNHLLSAYSNGSIKLWRCDDSDFVCTGTAYTNEVQSDAELDDDYDDNASLDNFFPKTSGLDYNSVRCLLLLPSPTLNLNSARDKHDMIPRSPNAWSSAFEDSDNISDDDMELNLNDFNVKISPNVNDKIYNGSSSGYTHAQRRKRNGKENSHIHSYYNHPFWILSGTCDGSLLMHKLDDGSNTNIHHQY
mmetsp:Transcript_26913/g.44124  ORF Transcript_26913/g.44124 Transcript_26913/m.44124 type:complete len:416 (-) Transcript_26913:7-1254(-)